MIITRIQKKLHNLWSKEWLVKFISLCLAVMLWYFVGGEDVVEKNITVPIEVINLPSDLIISNKYKRDIDVTVRGPRSLIVEMGKSQEARQIDLSKATPGTKVEEISVASVPVSRGVEVLRVQPSSIILSLDKLIKKEIQINAVTTGSVMPGYVLQNLQIDPKSITIAGPQTILSRVDVLKTVPININGLSESVQLQIPLELDAILVDLIGETSVTADLTIGYDSVEKTISKVPVSVVVGGFLQEVKPPVVSVTLKIPKMIIKKNMDFSSLFTVTAVSANDEEDRRRLKVQVVPAPSLTVPLEILSLEPEYVSLAAEPLAPKNAESDSQPQENLKAEK
ncbi:MAG: CdaR family protein [Desulfopila sp.]|jgi:YbbR domain-containing protein|nr:CdaR family protein [Desulfopila sp.]